MVDIDVEAIAAAVAAKLTPKNPAPELTGWDKFFQKKEI